MGEHMLQLGRVCLRRVGIMVGGEERRRRGVGQRLVFTILQEHLLPRYVSEFILDLRSSESSDTCVGLLTQRVGGGGGGAVEGRMVDSVASTKKAERMNRDVLMEGGWCWGGKCLVRWVILGKAYIFRSYSLIPWSPPQSL